MTLGSSAMTQLGIALITAGGLAMSVMSDGYTPFVLALVALTTITGVGLNILLGLAGQVSFGHVGFYSIGAYAVAILTLKGMSFWLALPIAGLLAGVVGALFALPALRVTGPYLAMMTIAFSFIVEHGTIEWRALTGGQNGLAGFPHPSLGPLNGERAMAAISVVLAGLSLWAFEVLARGSWGRAMIAVRDSETASSSVGLQPVVVKTIAFALSAFFTGLAGGCFAVLLSFIAPSAFPFSQSILFLLAVVVGGAGWTFGPVIGALVTVVLPELVAGLAEYRLLMFGCLLLVVLWIAPDGIIGSIARHFSGRSSAAADGAGFSITDFLARPYGSEALEIDRLSLSFGGIRAANDVALTAEPGRITGLIGPNGAGKTTVLNMASGFYRPDAGSIRLGRVQLAGQSASAIARAGIARTYQTTQLFGSLSALENVTVGLRVGHLGNPLAPAATSVQRREAEGLLALVGYRGAADMAAAALPHVDRRLIEIARALATRPNVLLLDEPAAGLTAGDKEHLKSLLRVIASAGIAVVLGEHDMNLVMGVGDHSVVLDAGRPIAAGQPAEIRSDERVRAAYLGTGHLMPRPREEGAAPPAEVVLSVRAVDAGYGALPVLSNVSFEVRRGELVALLGANGAGKSTTMRAVSGLLRPVGGRIELAGASIGAAPAHRIAAAGLALVPEGRQIFAELSVRDNLALGAYTHPSTDIDAEIEILLQRFPRLKDRIDGRAGLLSGGEAQMLAVARGLMMKPQILLLDEPSLGLAPAIIEELYGTLDELRAKGTTLLLVDQMAAMALGIADRGYLIAAGQIVHSGTAAELRRDPALEGAYLGSATIPLK
jgi:ABC-type branched-subunit amino acid transport system ATPase component/ABC-type branched-subunit amino acid transport system permease subunit